MQEKIEKLTKENFNEVLNISEEQFDKDSWTNSQFEDCLKNENYITYVFYKNNKVACFLIAQNLIDSINLLLIGTKNEFKRMGLASILIEKLIQKAKSNNIKTWLEVRKDNLPAINLYKKLGFKEIFERKNYYKDGSSAIIYEKY